MNITIDTKTLLAPGALYIAKSQMGIEENPRGSNSGPEVNAYLKSVGLDPGYAWCMAFVYWCVGKAAINLGTINPLIKTGGVMRQWNETSLKKIVDPREVRIGDIFIMSFSGGNGHTGFVENTDGLSIHTIEGNTNDEGGREGYEVARRIRPASSFKGFIRLD